MMILYSSFTFICYNICSIKYREYKEIERKFVVVYITYIKLLTQHIIIIMYWKG